MADPSWSKHVADILRRNDILTYATVPDYIVSHVLEHLWADERCRVVTVTREEEGVGLLSGAFLGGRRGALLWDNEIHQTTGGQPTATASRADLAAIARGAGVDKTLVVRTEDDLERAWDRVLADEGPLVAVVKVAKGPSDNRLDRDVIGSTRRFMHALAGG